MTTNETLLRTALKNVTDVLDAFGDLSDSQMDPEPWNKYEAQKHIEAARTLLANLSQSSELPCPLPPEGWFCTRPIGHEGPCAAHPDKAASTMPENYERVIRFLRAHAEHGAAYRLERRFGSPAA